MELLVSTGVHLRVHGSVRPSILHAHVHICTHTHTPTQTIMTNFVMETEEKEDLVPVLARLLGFSSDEVKQERLRGV